MTTKVVTDDIFVDVVKTIKDDIKKAILKEINEASVDSKIVNSLVDKAIYQIFDPDKNLSELLISVISRQIKNLDLESIISKELGNTVVQDIKNLRIDIEAIKNDLYRLNDSIGTIYDPNSLQGKVWKLNETIGGDFLSYSPWSTNLSHADMIRDIEAELRFLEERLRNIENNYDNGK